MSSATTSKPAFKMPRKIEQQVIVITGASSGIGLATAKMAAKRGAKVVLASRNTDDLRHIVSEIRETGGTAIAVTCDVKNQAEVEDLRDQAITKFGRIDTWVNNAGASAYGYVYEIPLDELRQQFEINFWGLHYGCLAAIEAMRETGGMIVNLGSEVSERAVLMQTMYSATKHAIKGYTEGLRSELERDGIPVGLSLIRPAAIDTPFAEHASNFLRDGAPSLPDPVYHPDVVAEAILFAAESGKRDVYAGGASKLAAIAEHISPRLLDYFMESDASYKATTAGQKKPRDIVNEGLMKAPETEGEVRGSHKGRVRSYSLWTSASLHPVATAAVVGTAGLVAAGLASAILNRENRVVAKPTSV